jgi:hypothetical protein
MRFICFVIATFLMWFLSVQSMSDPRWLGPTIAAAACMVTTHRDATRGGGHD